VSINLPSSGFTWRFRISVFKCSTRQSVLNKPQNERLTQTHGGQNTEGPNNLSAANNRHANCNWVVAEGAEWGVFGFTGSGNQEPKSPNQSPAHYGCWTYEASDQKPKSVTKTKRNPAVCKYLAILRHLLYFSHLPQLNTLTRDIFHWPGLNWKVRWPVFPKGIFNIAWRWPRLPAVLLFSTHCVCHCLPSFNLLIKFISHNAIKGSVFMTASLELSAALIDCHQSGWPTAPLTPLQMHLLFQAFLFMVLDSWHVPN